MRSVIRCSDASGQGVSSSEARNLLCYRAHKLENEVDLARAALFESSAQDNTVHECCVCGSSPRVGVSVFRVPHVECGGGCCKSTCFFLHVQSCSGLECVEGRFWELLPTGEGGVSV